MSTTPAPSANLFSKLFSIQYFYSFITWFRSKNLLSRRDSRKQAIARPEIDQYAPYAATTIQIDDTPSQRQLEVAHLEQQQAQPTTNTPLVIPASGDTSMSATGKEGPYHHFSPPQPSSDNREISNLDNENSSARFLAIIDNDAIAAQEIGRKEARRRAKENFRKKQVAEGRASSKPPRVFTIPTDESQDLGKTEVLLQRTHTGAQVISSSSASVLCTTLGISKLLEEMNDTLRTAYTLDHPIIASQLKACIEHEYDFGTAYARLRPRWFLEPGVAQRNLEECEVEDCKLRDMAMDARNTITNPRIPPRRVWDLYSNRVVPSWIVLRPISAVSHAWMSPERRHNVHTPINSYEWPVPIPIDITLEHVRIELLNHGLQYVWLDVLCLRQQGRQEMESLRIKEWAIDVPTIGNVYHQNQKTICYYSGLGRPFRIEDLDSDRHWLNRAWTLQEATTDSTTAGITADSPTSQDVDEETGEYHDPVVGRFYNALGSMAIYAQELDSIFQVLNTMRHRAAVSELDKIAGLAYLLRSKVLPAYIPGQLPEDAWRRLIETVAARYRGDLLFQFPVPGNGRHSWRPSWEQVTELVLPRPGFLYEEVKYVEQDDTYFHTGYRLDHCLVEGLSEPGDGQVRRQGRIVMIGSTGIKSDFEVVAFHSHPIPDGEYSLVGSQGFEYWVVGRAVVSGKLEKVSVIRMMSKVERIDIGKVESQWA